MKKAKYKDEEDKEDPKKLQVYQDANRVVNVIFGGDTWFLTKPVQMLTLREIMSTELATKHFLKIQWGRDLLLKGRSID